METTPLYTFTSHIAGKNAQVEIFADRIEWTRTGSAAAHWTKATMTLGASLLAGKKAESETLLLRQVTNVATKRDGLSNTLVNVTTAGGTVGFRVSHKEAEQVKAAILGAMSA